MDKALRIAAGAIVLAVGFLWSTGWHWRDQPVRTGHPDARGEAVERGAESDWFMVQRAFPRNDVPVGAATAMSASMKQFSSLSPRTPLGVDASDWKSAGPANVGGRITALLIHPLNDSILYAAAASGGIWKTTDRGTSWSNIFNESFSIGALAFSPGDPNTVYVGTGEANPSSVDTYPGNGLWRSTDAGATWTNLGLAELGQIGKITINPLNPNTIFVAGLGLYRTKTVDRGIYRSTDRGASWTKVLYVSDTTGAADVVINPQDTTDVLATSWTDYRTLAYVSRGGPGSALYNSTDGGATWTKNVSGMPHDDANIGRISLCFAPSDPTTVYALVAGGGGYNWYGVYRSQDAGASWFLTFSGSGFPESQVWYNNIILVHPTNVNVVWAGMTNLYKSTDGGSTFTYASIGGDYHVDHHAMAYAATNPNVVVLGNDGGIYISDDGGSFWQKSYDLPITQYYAGTVSQLNPNHILAGAQDNGSSMTHTGTSPWTFFYGGDGFYCVIDPTDSNYVYAEYQYGGLGYSTNGGASFYGGTTGISGSEFAGWMTPIVIDSKHPKSLYTGFERVYRTTNHMQSWTPISPILTNHISAAYSTVSTIDVSSVDSSIVYAGTGDGKVWVTTNAGGVWTDISAGLPLRWVTRVVADPESASVAYVTLSGFRQYDAVAHVFRTRNYGQTWTNIGASLPDVPVNDLIVDPATPSTLYIATDLNVMVTTDLGASWSVLGSSLPAVTVHDLAFNTAARRLVAFTHGRSTYTIDLPPPGTSGVTLSLGARWNMVSVPLRAADSSLAALFPPASGPAFAYQTGSGYTPVTSLSPHLGYWIQVGASVPPPVTLSGVPVNVDTIAVGDGWNLIGSVFTPVAGSSIVPLGTSIVSNIFAYAGGYVIADTLFPGRAHWIKVSQAGRLVLGPGTGGARAVWAAADDLQACDRIDLRDASGESRSLYCLPSQSGAATHGELPPVPPGTVFDIRFADNSFVGVADRRLPIRLQGVRYPLTIRPVLHGGGSMDLEADGKRIAPSNGVYTVARPQELTVAFSSAGEMPAAYALSENYPNPFNPSTSFVCSLPEDSYLSVVIYDNLGRMVKKVADGNASAGRKAFAWDAKGDDGRSVASGIYLCRMEARPLSGASSGMVFVRKLVYLR